MFRCDNPNIITSDEGFSVQVLGVTGLQYRERDATLRISSEVLASPHGVVVYQSSIKNWDDGEVIDEARRNEIVGNIRRAFAFRGVAVEVI